MKWALGVYAVLVIGTVAYETLPDWLGKTCLLGTCVMTMALPLWPILKVENDSPYL